MKKYLFVSAFAAALILGVVSCNKMGETVISGTDEEG